MTEQMISVVWKNDCGETLLVEELFMSEVLEIVTDNERGEWNGYVLPDGREVDNQTFRTWYTNHMEVVTS
jgi:hypothetical protein